MRPLLVILAIVALVGVAGLLTIDRSPEEVDPWVECTMERRNLAATSVVSREPLDSVGFAPIAELEGALAMDFHPIDGTPYVATKTGTVERIDGSSVTTVLDLSIKVSTTLEQGLLGIAVDPTGTHLYLNFTDTDGHTNVVEFGLDEDGNPEASTRRQVLFVEQPFHTHNGGHLTFGPDGYLWIGLGDGGGSLMGPSFGYGENAQDLSSLHGSLLRIDPRPSGEAAYAIPEGNPFVGVEGARGEIWMIG